ncbi:GNAT family N-acetyltransferase [Rhodococcoides corynebacterioides]|uniref:GNAT family N-acetyltransferase n=1 Tax=Rhodococcoides corynebacterioides TaxID=53972 RepID=A0ABS7P2S4_9NOCA|nr:GNAT family N-acetyltransferase [Rhodococcus corynebacterioides]MBY6366700.1 GNAT family N-acetyltransferase [Rhodococcus corynebacterioides]MBY6408749.1 GNAT family N-acetyltransferase [Rhodococcus corynebacterioides]
MRARLTEALAVYVDAMGYPPGTDLHRAPMWSEHILRPGWRAVCALRDDCVVGIAYCYRGDHGQWWHRQVRDGMRRAGWSPGRAESVLADYVELTELHVAPHVQGAGVGSRLLTALLADRSEQRVLLSTPEVHAEDNRAWRLYRRAGFVDVLRHFRFAGDSRPFAVLGRDLPLDVGEPDVHHPTAATPAATITEEPTT